MNETLYDRFLTIKRFAVTWQHISKNIADDEIRRGKPIMKRYPHKDIFKKCLNNTGYFQNLKLLNYDHPLPTSVDLRGAALAIARVQETYKLNTTDLIKGKIRNYEAKCV